MPTAGSRQTGKHMMLLDKSTGQITVSIATADTAAGSECPVQCINKATVKQLNGVVFCCCFNSHDSKTNDGDDDVE